MSLLAHLTENHGWTNPAASDAELRAEASRLIKSGDLLAEKFVEVVTPTDSPLDKVTNRITEALEKSLNRPAKPAGVTANEVLAGGSNPDVKRASAHYSDAKSAACYTRAHGKREGMPILFRGAEINHASNRDRALAGAFMQVRLLRQAGMSERIHDHMKDLYEECIHTEKFCGDAPRISGGIYEYQGERLLDEHIKASVYGDASGASGGFNLIPQVLETELIIPKILFGELTPYVDIVSQPKGSSVDTASMIQLTVGAGPEEVAGSMVPQATTGLFTKVNSPFFVVSGAIEIGKDFLADSAIDVMGAITKSYNDQVQKYLDYCIAIGNGTTQPLGLFTISGPSSVVSTNGSTGSFAVADFENTLRGLGKQYRANKSPDVRWVSNDTTYWRARGVPVGASDARRVFGMDYESYQFAGRPWSVQNDIGNTKLGFGDLSLYRLWSKPGAEMFVEKGGRTLVLANSILVGIRSRWAGRLLDPAAFVKMTTAPQ